MKVNGTAVISGINQYMDIEYDYFALERFEKYARKIEQVMGEKYVLSVSLREVHFEVAEMTYKEELSRLKRKINRQYDVRVKENA